jgi:hypothetical protein
MYVRLYVRVCISLTCFTLHNAARLCSPVATHPNTPLNTQRCVYAFISDVISVRVYVCMCACVCVCVCVCVWFLKNNIMHQCRCTLAVHAFIHNNVYLLFIGSLRVRTRVQISDIAPKHGTHTHMATASTTASTNKLPDDSTALAHANNTTSSPVKRTVSFRDTLHLTCDDNDDVVLIPEHDNAHASVELQPEQSDTTSRSNIHTPQELNNASHTPVHSTVLSDQHVCTVPASLSAEDTSVKCNTQEHVVAEVLSATLTQERADDEIALCNTSVPPVWTNADEHSHDVCAEFPLTDDVDLLTPGSPNRVHSHITSETTDRHSDLASDAHRPAPAMIFVKYIATSAWKRRLSTRSHEELLSPDGTGLIVENHDKEMREYQENTSTPAEKLLEHEESSPLVLYVQCTLDVLFISLVVCMHLACVFPSLVIMLICVSLLSPC